MTDTKSRPQRIQRRACYAAMLAACMGISFGFFWGMWWLLVAGVAAFGVVVVAALIWEVDL